MKRLPLASMENILKKSSNIRISESAKKELREVLESEIKQISPKAQEFAEHSKRKTIKKQDIEMVLNF
ncbi:DUF1931 family protein [archaeon]|nr:DUF1931 family protein [archaeon]MBT4272507.1 DUF1931 family protein [archaeon]MBT4460605.1 DUF1931 family protein [archaeon]MBT4857805.1 DUF1931 family protein [archaeon]MBT5423180.1 DUF1931 family protein [archaeon]